MPLVSKNPYTEEVIATFDEHTSDEIEAILVRASEAFVEWKKTSFAERATLMKSFADILERDKEKLAKLATLEMGRTITAAIGEIEKCAACARFFAENAEQFLAEEIIESSAKKSLVRYEPLGAILAVMPWNFPYWQVVRFLAPTIMAGNVGLLKHASNVPQCGIAIEAAMTEAGFPLGVFQNMKIGGARVGDIIDDDRVSAVTLTGSEPAGREVASRAAKNIKKSVLELGGSDPFIVAPDVDLEKVIPVATTARIQNAGQTCISAKRFLVHESLYEDFVSKLKVAFENIPVGDPMNPGTVMGPLATASIRDDIAKLVDETRAQGGTIVTGGVVPEGKGYMYPATIITGVTKDMTIYHEETFAPVATVFSWKTPEEAITIANDTRFGLGASIWTNDEKLADMFARNIDVGFVAINDMVKSHHALPFGGTKKSGFGRELSVQGIREFTNIKTIWIG